MAQRVHIRVGRNASNQLVIDHPAIADVHLELFADNEGNVFVTDLGSTQGTAVNGVRLKGYTLLREGDDVILGGKIRLHWEKYSAKKPDSIQPIPEKAQPKPNPFVQPSQDKVQLQNRLSKKGSKQEAKMRVSNISLILIFGAIFLIFFLMYVLN